MGSALPPPDAPLFPREVPFPHPKSTHGPSRPAWTETQGAHAARAGQPGPSLPFRVRSTAWMVPSSTCPRLRVASVAPSSWPARSRAPAACGRHLLSPWPCVGGAGPGQGRREHKWWRVSEGPRVSREVAPGSCLAIQLLRVLPQACALLLQGLQLPCHLLAGAQRALELALWGAGSGRLLRRAGGRGGRVEYLQVGDGGDQPVQPRPGH